MLESSKTMGWKARLQSAQTASTSPVSELDCGASTGATWGRNSWWGGYVPSHLGVDSLVVRFYRGKDLLYAARVRAGLVPATRRQVFERLKSLKAPKCPFTNLPELTAGRWGQGLTAEKMKECAWVRPEASRNPVLGVDRRRSLETYEIRWTERRHRSF
jgi:hypothetical protein